MTGEALKTGRERANLTQQEAASRLGLTQAYLSMLERGRRRVTAELAAQATRVFHLPPTTLPLDVHPHPTLDENDFKSELGALGYPGFSYLRGKSHYNPGRLLFLALDQDDLDRRVVEALPWLVYTYPEMDWVCSPATPSSTTARTGSGSLWLWQKSSLVRRENSRERRASRARWLL